MAICDRLSPPPIPPPPFPELALDSDCWFSRFVPTTERNDELIYGAVRNRRPVDGTRSRKRQLTTRYLNSTVDSSCHWLLSGVALID